MNEIGLSDTYEPMAIERDDSHGHLHFSPLSVDSRTRTNFLSCELILQMLIP